jgi:GTP-binding protein HflX
LKHIATRLVRGWTHLERQRGGGIGNRGPGETQLETDRRLLGTRVKVLTKRLEKLRQQRETGRSARAGIPVPAIALVGYTNAGKSTLFNAITGADAYVANQLFATLDPTVRRMALPGGTQIVASDTVGFIRELPHELVAAFRSTLQEARSAHLLLHVIDAADARRGEYTEQVNAVLAEIDAGELPQLLVYNKIDRLEVEPRIERDAEGVATQVWISAAKGLGLDLLARAIGERLQVAASRHWLRLPPQAGALRARLFAAGVVRAELPGVAGEMLLQVEVPQAEHESLLREPGVAGWAPPEAESPCAPGGAFLESTAAALAGALH